MSTVDVDARLMHTNGDGRNLDACYNVQSVVDEKNKLVIDFDVTNQPADKGALVIMTESAKEIMGVNKIKTVADKGFYDGEDIGICEGNGTTCYIPGILNYKQAPDERYNKSKFVYRPENDCYICPENQSLTFIRENKRTDGTIDKHYENKAACKNCSSREKCTPNKTGRKIFRSPNQDMLDKINARMQTDEGREIFRLRKKIVEHPHGSFIGS